VIVEYFWGMKMFNGWCELPVQDRGILEHNSTLRPTSTVALMGYRRMNTIQRMSCERSLVDLILSSREVLEKEGGLFSLLLPNVAAAEKVRLPLAHFGR
jgi:hypothetical protein